MKKNELIISHGDIEHNINKKDDCMECIEVQLEYYQEIKKAGGITKFLASLK